MHSNCLSSGSSLSSFLPLCLAYHHLPTHLCHHVPSLLSSPLSTTLTAYPTPFLSVLPPLTPISDIHLPLVSLLSPSTFSCPVPSSLSIPLVNVPFSLSSHPHSPLLFPLSPLCSPLLAFCLLSAHLSLLSPPLCRCQLSLLWHPSPAILPSPFPTSLLSTPVSRFSGTLLPSPLPGLISLQPPFSSHFPPPPFPSSLSPVSLPPPFLPLYHLPSSSPSFPLSTTSCSPSLLPSQFLFPLYSLPSLLSLYSPAPLFSLPSALSPLPSREEGPHLLPHLPSPHLLFYPIQFPFPLFSPLLTALPSASLFPTSGPFPCSPPLISSPVSVLTPSSPVPPLISKLSPFQTLPSLYLPLLLPLSILPSPP